MVTGQRDIQLLDQTVELLVRPPAAVAADPSVSRRRRLRGLELGEKHIPRRAGACAGVRDARMGRPQLGVTRLRSGPHFLRDVEAGAPP